MYMEGNWSQRGHQCVSHDLEVKNKCHKCVQCTFLINNVKKKLTFSLEGKHDHNPTQIIQKGRTKC